LAAGALQAAVVAAQLIPKFAEGGEVKGASHERGGVQAELEGGEFVIKAKQVQKYPDLVKAINNDELRVRNDLVEKFHIQETSLDIKETKEIKEIRDMMRKIMNKPLVEYHGEKKIVTFGNVRRTIG